MSLLSVSAGMPRYPAPYPMVRPGFVPRPMPPPGVVPIQRPPIIPGMRGVPPLVAPAARPPPPAVTPADKPPTAVYVGKIAPTVDNDWEALKGAPRCPRSRSMKHQPCCA
jgi:RNA-binding protein 25